MKKVSIIIILLIIGIGSMDTNMFKLNYNSKYKVGEFKKQVVKFMYLNKFGILSDDGEVIISPSFDDIKDIELRDRFFVKKNGKWGIINKFRKIIIDYEYEDIRELDKNKYIVQKNGKWGIIGKDNEIEIPIKYENIKTIGNKIFLINTENVEIITKSLKKIETFNGENINILNEEGYLIKKEGEFFYTYKNQKIKIDEKIEQIYNNFLVINENGKRHIKNILDKDSKLEKYEFDGIFIQDLKNIIVEKNGKYGVYNINMKEIVPIKFDKISGFYNNFYIYENEYKCGVIDSKGNVILQNKYNTINEVRGDLIIASKESGIGIVNVLGKEVVPFIYDDIKFIGNQNFILFSREKLIVSDKKSKKFELSKQEILNIYSSQINTLNKIYIFR